MTVPDLHWARQDGYTGCMYHTLYALTGDAVLLSPEYKQDHNFVRWVLAAIERGYIPETVYCDSSSWREELGTDALRPMPKANWLQATWRYPEQEEHCMWAVFALCMPSRRRQRAQHMVALMVGWVDGDWRFGVSDSTAPQDGVQWFEGSQAFTDSPYGTVFEVIAMRPRWQADQPWLIAESEMPPLIEAGPPTLEGA